jgi:hypothetical protein
MRYFLGILLLLIATASSHADLSYVGAIPAPDPCCGQAYMTGLASTHDYLFATVRCESESHLYLLRPDNGGIAAEKHFNLPPPNCDANYAQLVSAAYVGGLYYWVGDACGVFMKIAWLGDTLSIFDHFTIPPVPSPSGLYCEDDTLFTIDYDQSILVKIDPQHYIVDQDTVYEIESPTALTMYRGNFFVTSSAYNDRLFEITKDGTMVGTHYFNGRLVVALSATFHDGLLYIGAAGDSIRIFELTSYNTEVPEGENVVVNAVPGEVVITFEDVDSSGIFTTDVGDSQMCPSPEGVELYPPFFDMSTSAAFEYIAALELTFDDENLPQGYNCQDLRIFKRPSGECAAFRDVTVDSVVELPSLYRMMRTVSEEDEFSVFALGRDLRKPKDVVDMKLDRVNAFINANAESIPPEAYDEMTRLLQDAEKEYYQGLPLSGEETVDYVATIVREAPGIPHRFTGEPGSNVGGGIVSRCHTLGFSMRHSDRVAKVTQAVIRPRRIMAGIGTGWIRAFIEIPEGYQFSDVDPLHVYMDGSVRAIPDSVRAVDYDGDTEVEVRALFRRSKVVNLFASSGPATVRLTTFIDGFELRADVNIEVRKPTIEVIAKDFLLAGSTYRVTWSAHEDEANACYEVHYSLDGGQSWHEMAAGITDTHYDWQAPDVETDQGKLRVYWISNGLEDLVLNTDLLPIVASAGLDDTGQAADGLILSPNPSSSSFTIRFSSDGRRPVSLDVYSVRGELVKTLIRGVSVEGTHSIVWQGDNENGSAVSPGAYFAVIRQGDKATIKKIVLER